MDKLTYLNEQIQQLKDEGVYRKLPIRTTACGQVIVLNGKQVINLSSNNYLGFADHPRIKAAAANALEKYGAGAGAVRTIVGNIDLIEELESLLAAFKEEEAVTCFQSGLNCNIGTIQAITAKGDLIVSDALNHASIIDGVRLSQANKAVYKHNDMDDLENILKKHRDAHRNVLIITDGVFSMDGDLAPLDKIVDLAKHYNAMTYVDDAHGSGVLGRSGRGTVDHFGLHGEVDFIIGTLSKAIGVVGGYVASKAPVKEWLLHRARPLLFSTALPPAAIAATIESVKMLMESDTYTKKLWENARFFKNGLSQLGFDTGISKTPITPVMIGDEAKTMAFSSALLDEGVFVSGIVHPTVPKGKGRLRAMISAAHTETNLTQALQAFKHVGNRLGIV